MGSDRNKHLGMGIFLALTFWGVLALIFSPVFGEGRNGLAFADNLFNKLSKGSSYFIPKIMKANEKFIGKPFSVSIKVEEPADAEKIVKLFDTAGARAVIQGKEISLEGDLGKVMEAVLKDADAMYQNDGAKVSGIYGMDGKEVLQNWWQALSKMSKVFAKEKKIEEAKHVSDVYKKTVETAFNYYGIEPQKVIEKAGLMTSLLAFYVVYTMWWGFAIFYIFEGIGLTMKKAKVKKEV